jgi:hypothetical protein
VRKVQPGDLIHVAFSSEQDAGTTLEGLGSFEVLDAPHPDQEGPVEDARHGRLSLFRVREGSPLDQLLTRTTYSRDPRLGVFTGWHVREVEPRQIAFTQAMFPGHNALHKFDRGALGASGRDSPAPSAPLPSNPILLPAAGRFLGVDWSGSVHAGKKVWVAALLFDSGGARLEFVRRPFPTGLDAAGVAAGFAGWLEAERFDAAGLDFCFGIARGHGVAGMPTTGPADLGRWLAACYPTPEEFKTALGPERKRSTDRVRRSPFAPTNLRMFRQTYWGLRALAAVILPVLPWSSSAERVVVEVLPAHVASVLCPGCRYKGPGSQASAERRRLLAAAVSAARLEVPAEAERVLLDDAEGDALDALLAALATAVARASNFAGPPSEAAESGEGWIYSVQA